MSKRMLITGGCGFIGANLIALLQKKGTYDVRVFDNESLGKQEYIAEFDVEFIHGDLRDAQAVREAVRGVDSVVHLAADTRVMDSIDDPIHNFQTNVVGTFNLLTAMRDEGVESIANASTGGAILGEVPPPVNEEMLPNPESPYGASKLAVEGYLSAFTHSYGMKATSLRFSNVYGPRSYHKGSVVAHLFKQILAGKEFVVYGDGSQNRDYVFIEDLCTGIIQAIEAGKSGACQLGTGIPTTINDLIELVRETVGDTHNLKVRYADFRDGEIVHTWCDISKARDAFGYAPETTLKDGLDATWHWFIKNLKA